VAFLFSAFGAGDRKGALIFPIGLIPCGLCASARRPVSGFWDHPAAPAGNYLVPTVDRFYHTKGTL